jgi:hypothetical protein
MSTKTREIDSRLEKSLNSTFGSPNPGIKGEEFSEFKPAEYRPKRYTIPKRLSCCPECGTSARHPVKEVLVPRKGVLLDCVWCDTSFNTLGNCL